MSDQTVAVVDVAPDRPYIDDLLKVLARARDRAVLRRAGIDTTGSELLASIYRHARALERLGIGRGDLVALYAPNRPEALAIRYATHLLGAASVYLSAPTDAEIRARMLADFAPRLVIVFGETRHLLPNTTAEVAAVGAVSRATVRLDECAATEDDTPLPPRAHPEDLAVVISSGGTTGVPKGSTRDMTAWTAAVRGPRRPERRQLANGNLAYLTQILVDQTLLGDGLVVLDDTTDPATVLDTVQRERITDLFLVEPQLFALMDHPDVARTDLSSLQALTHIGASAPPTLRRRAHDRLGPRIAHTYGASEMGIVSALTPAEHDSRHPARFSSAGHIVSGVEVRFRRSDGTLDPGRGAIEVRSPAMAQGYRHRPVEQATNFDRGWYRTGDLGRLDAEGYLHILGRAVDCNVVGGTLLTPTALEDTLCRMARVRYAVVVVDHDTGTRIAATVPWPGVHIDALRCTAAISAEHGHELATTLTVMPLDRIPLTEQGKPDRQAIHDLAAARGLGQATSPEHHDRPEPLSG